MIRLIVISILFLSTIILVSLAIITISKRKIVGKSAIYLACCLAAISLYCFGYGLELSSNSLDEVIFWVRFEHIGIQFLAPFWFIFVLYQTAHTKWINIYSKTVLFGIAFFFYFCSQTLGRLNWMHKNPRINWVHGMPIFDYDATPIMTMAVVYMSLLVITCFLLLTMLMIRSAPALKSRTLILWIGSFIPWISELIYFFGFSLYDLDIAPIAFTISGIIASIGILKYNILTVVPLARSLIFDGMRDAALVLNLNGEIIDFNYRLTKIFPFVNHHAVGKLASDVFASHPEIQSLLESNKISKIEISVNQNGIIHFYQVNQSELNDRSGNKVGYVVTFYFYTEIKKLVNKLEEFATHDQLTGVNNRRRFIELAETEIKRSIRYCRFFAVVLFDLDHFKQINDRFGHLAGDVVLKAVARTSQEGLRSSDVFGRFGGEEFVFLLPETNLDDGQFFAERMRSAIQNLSLLEFGIDTNITASFGVTSYESQDSIELEEMLRAADQALYQAKFTGRNRVCSCPVEKSNLQH
ncbi:MAG: diguanylate cyclase [Flexilinea flocculi]|nr:diguanylate cyclase [Flexilinea flocculi]